MIFSDFPCYYNFFVLNEIHATLKGKSIIATDSMNNEWLSDAAVLLFSVL